MKKQSDLSRLTSYAGKHRCLTCASRVTTFIGAPVRTPPFYYIRLIIREAIEVAPNFSEATHVVRYGISGAKHGNERIENKKSIQNE